MLWHTAHDSQRHFLIGLSFVALIQLAEQNEAQRSVIVHVTEEIGIYVECCSSA